MPSLPSSDSFETFFAVAHAGGGGRGGFCFFVLSPPSMSKVKSTGTPVSWITNDTGVPGVMGVHTCCENGDMTRPTKEFQLILRIPSLFDLVAKPACVIIVLLSIPEGLSLIHV